MRLLGAQGFSVSMPFKESVLAHLDVTDPDASAIGAANTVVVDEHGVWHGYNTDCTGAQDECQQLLLTPVPRTDSSDCRVCDAPQIANAI